MCRMADGQASICAVDQSVPGLQRALAQERQRGSGEEPVVIQHNIGFCLHGPVLSDLHSSDQHRYAPIML